MIAVADAVEILDAIADFRVTIKAAIDNAAQAPFVTHEQCSKCRENLDKSLHMIGTQLERRSF